MKSLSPFDRTSLIRHLALCAAALIAYVAREHLMVGNSVLWVFGLATLFNLLTVTCSNLPGIGFLARVLSPFFGLGGWTALMMLTGGVKSPFVAGLFLEIVLAALSTSLVGILLVTGGAVAGLWAQQVVIGVESLLLTLALQTGFLLVIGGLTYHVVWRRRRSEQQQSRRQAELCWSLQELSKDLEKARTAGKLGENVARLAHGFKNAAHSLRGFARLIEPKLSGSEQHLELLNGLRMAIDRLEDLSRTTLGPPGPPSQAKADLAGVGAPRVLREVITEIGIAYPEIRWAFRCDETLPSMPASSAVIREVLGSVIRNAAEAMEGRGEVVVEAASRGNTWHFKVRDHGPGLSQQDLERMFEPGYTTKPAGHGFGLFLARQLLASHGGTLRMATVEGGGTECCVELPGP